jgi:UDP-glucose 4-epimerase
MTLKNKRIAVTGGCGFIGSHLVDYLAKNDNEIIIIDDLSSGKLENIEGIEGRITNHRMSILDDIKPLLEGVDVIFHLAANVSVIRSIEDPMFDARVNIDGTLNLLEIARSLDIPKLVYSSSCAVYGDIDVIPTDEEQVLSPTSPYGVSKSVAEMYCKLYSRLNGLKTVCLRYFNVYGIRQEAKSPYSGVIAKFIYNSLSGQPFVIFGDGEQSRDFIAVSDVVAANIAAAGSDKGGEVYNIGTGEPTTVNRMADHFDEISGKVERIHEPAREGEIKFSLADITKAEKEMNFRSKVPLKQGISDLYEASKP